MLHIAGLQVQGLVDGKRRGELLRLNRNGSGEGAREHHCAEGGGRFRRPDAERRAVERQGSGFVLEFAHTRFFQTEDHVTGEGLAFVGGHGHGREGLARPFSSGVHDFQHDGAGQGLERSGKGAVAVKGDGFGTIDHLVQVRLRGCCGAGQDRRNIGGRSLAQRADGKAPEAGGIRVDADASSEGPGGVPGHLDRTVVTEAREIARVAGPEKIIGGIARRIGRRDTAGKCHGNRPHALLLLVAGDRRHPQQEQHGHP